MVRLRILCLIGLLFSFQGHADTLDMQGIDTADGQARPTRGMSMARVEQTFGSPTNRRAAVGEPPISRWEYPNFTVYFEHQFVIHAVLNR